MALILYYAPGFPGNGSRIPAFNSILHDCSNARPIRTRPNNKACFFSLQPQGL